MQVESAERWVGEVFERSSNRWELWAFSETLKPLRVAQPFRTAGANVLLKGTAEAVPLSKTNLGRKTGCGKHRSATFSSACLSPGPFLWDQDKAQG